MADRVLERSAFALLVTLWAVVGWAQTSTTAPTVRQSLLPLAQPLWSELKPAQQNILAPLDEQWNSMPIDEKRSWVALAGRFPKMSAAEQLRASARIRELAKLNHEQRRMVRQNYRLAKSLPQHERMAQSEQYQNMTDEQKHVLQTSGSTSNTAAKHAGSRTALAKEASQPLNAEPKPVSTQTSNRAGAAQLPVNSLQPNRN
jgi:Protein of unknown function (DUF3106)